MTLEEIRAADEALALARVEHDTALARVEAARVELWHAQGDEERTRRQLRSARFHLTELTTERHREKFDGARLIHPDEE